MTPSGRLSRARLVNAISVLAACGAGEMMAGMGALAASRPETFDETLTRETKSIAQRQRETAEQGNNCTASEGRAAVDAQYKRNVQLDRERKEAARLRKAGVEQ